MFNHFLDGQQTFTDHAGSVMCALRTVGTVLGTTPGFYGEQGADLNGVGRMMLTVNTMGFEQEIVERHFKQVSNLCD
jgi:hypothetical protein